MSSPASPAGADEQTLLRGNKLLITIAAMIAGLMAFLDISIVNVALSDIRASFGTPLDQIAWVSTSYAMANITIIPMSGWLLKRFGFRRYYTSSIFLFTVASVLCGLAWDLRSLVVFRILQGLGGGAIIPTSQSVLFSRYPQRQHGMAGAMFAIGAITGPLLGPTVGGYLVEWSSWHLIFFLNLPLGLLSAYLAWTRIEQPSFVPDKSPIDYFGIVLLAIGMGSLQYVLEEGNRNGWFESTTIVVLACIAAVAIIAFISHELEIKHPVVDLRVFNNRGYAAATALSFLIGTALFAGSVMLSLYCGTIMHYRALDIGKLFLYGTWIQLLLFPIVGRLIGRIDPRWLLLIANVGIFMSLWLNAHLTPAVDMHGLVVPLFVRAIGTGFGFVSITVLGVSALSPAQRPGGTALFNLTRELGASIGIAWMSTLLDSDAKRAFAAMTSHVDAMSPAFLEQRALFVRSVGAWLRDPDAGAIAVVGQRLQSQSLLYAFNHGFLLLAFSFLLGSLLIPLMRRPPRPPAAHPR